MSPWFFTAQAMAASTAMTKMIFILTPLAKNPVSVFFASLSSLNMNQCDTLLFSNA
jgi:hypothetical protein